jgi:hypothetical protein
MGTEGHFHLSDFTDPYHYLVLVVVGARAGSIALRRKGTGNYAPARIN